MKVNVTVIDHDGTHWSAGRCRLEECADLLNELARWGLCVDDVDGNTFGRDDLSGTFCVLDGALSFVVDCRS